MYDYKVVVVDDNQAVLKSLKLVLEDVFASVVTLPHPGLLVSILAAERVDVVLLDMNFNAQKITGEEGVSWLRYIKSVPNPPAVVMITAFADIDLAITSMKEGAEDFITKPWDNETLTNKLLAAIDKRRHRQQQNEKVKKADDLINRHDTAMKMTLDEMERSHIVEVLMECKGNITEAALRLDISRQTLYSKLKKYGIVV